MTEPDVAWTSCSHPGDHVRYQPKEAQRGVDPLGTEACDACGATRLVEGDHSGPWHPRGTPPAWDLPSR